MFGLDLRKGLDICLEWSSTSFELLKNHLESKTLKGKVPN